VYDLAPHFAIASGAVTASSRHATPLPITEVRDRPRISESIAFAQHPLWGRKL